MTEEGSWLCKECFKNFNLNEAIVYCDNCAEQYCNSCYDNSGYSMGDDNEEWFCQACIDNDGIRCCCLEWERDFNARVEFRKRMRRLHNLPIYK